MGRFASVLGAAGLVGLVATLGGPAPRVGASPGAGTQDGRCAEPESQRRAAEGEEGDAVLQPVLVEHDDGTFEWVCFYVVERAGGETVLVDEAGDSYGDLDEFRAENELLSESDTLVVPLDIMDPDRSGDVELIEVSGRTSPDGAPWVVVAVGAVAVAAIAATAVVLVRRRSSSGRRRGAGADDAGA